MEVLITGAGPAGALAAVILARQGVRVRVFDRAAFPRDKLCGDTVNPGTLAVLARHLDVGPLVAASLPIDGMWLTGPRGVEVRGRYPAGLRGRAILRRDLDRWLLQAAVGAGAMVEERRLVVGPLVDGGGVAGVRVRSARGSEDIYRAPVIIAADGRRSRLAAACGLARQPARPRRWAICDYFDGVDAVGTAGEMHVRAGHYVGIAPTPGGLANVCLVSSPVPGAGWAAPSSLLMSAVASDPLLGPRFVRARQAAPAVVLGPMAVDVDMPGTGAMLLAGDAAGFIDPMTGDGLRFALEGAEMAAGVALDALAGRLPLSAASKDLARRRRARFARKWRFNRALRQLVDHPAAIAGAAMTARVLPAAFAVMIRYAGDCGLDGS